MTGLDATTDVLVEIAVVVTDGELNLLDDGLDIVIATDPAKLVGMDEVVQEMHTGSGLLTAIAEATTTLEEAEQQVLEYVKRWVPDRRKAPLCGNSIATDRTFIARYMPALDDHLHYRMVDVSSVKELARRWYPKAYYNAPAKHGGHRALADIIESVTELRYYRAAVMVPPPGPDTSAARAAATAAVLPLPGSVTPD
jgi:oligoribonuclease